MSKFKNIGIAEAGVVPDLSGVFARMVAGFQNISSQVNRSQNNVLQAFGKLKARSKKRAGIVESKANQVMASTDDIGLDEIISTKAEDLNKPIQQASFVKQEDVNVTVRQLDNLDVMKDSIIRLKTELVDFKKTASYKNMSEEAIGNLELLIDNNFQIGDVTKREITIGGSTISLDKLNKQYVKMDAQGIRNTQIVINRHVDPKNVQFNSISFNQDMNVLMDNRNDMGAKLMVADLSIGGSGTIEDQLINNIESFTSFLNSSNVDLNKDGTPDSQQITQENAVEFIKILKTPGDENYDEATTNSFVKSFLGNQTNKTYLANKTQIKLSEKDFSIDKFFRDNGRTGTTLRNISQVMQSLSRGDDPKAIETALNNLDFVIEKLPSSNEYQLYKAKYDSRETVKGGKYGRQDVPNPNFEKYTKGERVGGKFNVTKSKDIENLFEVMLRKAGVAGFDPEALYEFQQYLLKNPNYLTPGRVLNTDYSEIDNKK
tara:strand:+ start:7564 stop:9027 length:1464 start_codon:yes stop_codon:yes gene_type:complete